jgi:hypothetical protein
MDSAEPLDRFTALPPTRHIMVDLETLGTAPGSVIASIGAVAFDPVEGILGETFYAVIDPADAQRCGLRIDGETVLWWLRQGDEARAALTGGTRVSLFTALSAFSTFWERHKAKTFWGHGANFDDPLLASAYRAQRLDPPWLYYDSRCTRTLFELAGVKPDRTAGAHHNALDDAMAQARCAIEAFGVLRRRERAGQALAAIGVNT